jgi:hypothetical protein
MLRKTLYIALGILSLGLGAIGTVLPLVPTTPLVILAAICFGKSSQRLQSWLVSTKFYKNNIESFVKRRTMTIKRKIILLSIITLLMGTSFVMMYIVSAPVFGQVVLAIVWFVHVLYFGFKVKTEKGVE